MFALLVFSLFTLSRLFARVACDLADPTLVLFGFHPTQASYRATRFATIAVFWLTMYVSLARGIIALAG